MERAKPRHPLDNLPHHRADALLHLARGLVGEGDGEDFGWTRAAEREDVGDARGQDARLAGPRAGKHEQRPVERLDRLALFGIEPCQIGRRDIGARTRRDAARRGRGSSGELLTRNFYHTDAFSESLRPENGIAPSRWRGVGGSRLEPGARFSPASRCDDRLPPAGAGERAPFSYVKACALSCQGTAQPFWTSY